MIIRYTGDAISITGALRSGGAVVDPTGKTITAALLHLDRSELAAGTTAVTCTIVSAGAGTVKATWPSTATGSITPGRYRIQFRNDTAEEVQCELDVELRQGLAA